MNTADGAEGKPVRVAAYTGGRNVPAARFRIRQHVENLFQHGVRLDEFASRAGQYPPLARWRRPAWLLAACAERGLQVAGSYRYDAVIFQRELISTLLTLEPLFSGPRILDVDDAVWLHRRGSFAGKLANRCDAVVCGNEYLAEYFGRECEKTYVLPTAVDAIRFSPQLQSPYPSQVIGWSGTSGNLHELERIEPALHTVMSRFPKARLRVICNRRPSLSSLPSDRVEYVHWTPEIEVSALQDLQIGLMPLKDTAWSRGKCAFKMLTYMACGVPVVASPVGMNADVLAMGEVGFGARRDEQWVQGLSALLAEPTAARQMGKEGRLVIEENFSVEVLSLRLAEIIRTVVG
jgi:glycosyltransferase involved in cell wall biosynthesis